MIRDGKYRYTLQFGMDTVEERQAGQFLEQLGNRKSPIIVAALNKYLEDNPGLLDGRVHMVSRSSATASLISIRPLCFRISSISVDAILMDSSYLFILESHCEYSASYSEIFRSISIILYCISLLSRIISSPVLYFLILKSIVSSITDLQNGQTRLLSEVI